MCLTIILRFDHCPHGIVGGLNAPGILSHTLIGGAKMAAMKYLALCIIVLNLKINGIIDVLHIFNKLQ